jgi:hypothetical protein
MRPRGYRSWMTRIKRLSATLRSRLECCSHVVCFRSHNGLKSEITACPKSANKRHQLEMKEAAN